MTYYEEEKRRELDRGAQPRRQRVGGRLRVASLAGLYEDAVHPADLRLAACSKHDREIPLIYFIVMIIAACLGLHHVKIVCCLSSIGGRVHLSHRLHDIDTTRIRLRSKSISR